MFSPKGYDPQGAEPGTALPSFGEGLLLSGLWRRRAGSIGANQTARRSAKMQLPKLGCRRRSTNRLRNMVSLGLVGPTVWCLL